MLERIKADCQLAIISLFGACVVVGVLPFAVYRLATGAHRVAALDAAIAVGVALVVLAAWRTGHARAAGYVMAAINNLGAVLSALLLGDAGLVWIYAVLMSNFFLLPRSVAAGLSVAEIAGLAMVDGLFRGTPHVASFATSALLVSALSFILAHWTEHQRRQLEQLAAHDALTGLCNRRVMERDLAQAVLAGDRHGTPAGLAMIDLDHFKRVNDRNGHASGDAVLVALADVLRASVRKLDGVYRLGGEEFLVLLPGTDAAGLARVAEHLRCAIAERLVGPDGPMTASIGTASLRRGENADAWLSRADAALYRAKALGRDRVCGDGVVPAVPAGRAAAPAVAGHPRGAAEGHAT